MANPILNEKAAEQAARAGWAAPDAAVRSTNIPAITDGPVSSWQSAGDVMTVRGTVTAQGPKVVRAELFPNISVGDAPLIQGGKALKAAAAPAGQGRS